MKAIQIREHGGPEVLQIVDTAIPEPGPGQVRIRVRAAGLNPSDTYAVRGGYEFYEPELPWIPGFDSAGEIDALGEGVTEFAVGDRVFAMGILASSDGAFAQYHVAQARVVGRLPDQVSFAQGAALGVPYPTAYRALYQLGQLRHGQTVLIHGASGGVGQAAVQFARAGGATVIATAGSPDGLGMVHRLGAHHVVNHGEPGHTARIASLAPDGVDLIVEMAAHANLGADLELLAAGGTVVVVGARQPVEIHPRVLMRTEGQIRGLVLWSMNPQQGREALGAIEAGLADGSLAPVVGQRLPVEQAGRGFELVTTGTRHGKVVLDVD